MSLSAQLQRFKNQRGFTIVELLIVIAILGVLATILIAAIDPATRLKQSRDTRRKQDLTKIKAVLEQIRNVRDEYPCFSGHCTGAFWDVPGGATSLTVADNPATFTFQDYLQTIPKDPVYGTTCSGANTPYVYAYSANYSAYTIFINLENANDPLAKATKPTPLAGSGSVSGSNFNLNASGSCAAHTYNYWVNSD